MALAEPESPRLTAACHGSPERGSLDLASALRALAAAGLSADALRLATEALLLATHPLPGAAAGMGGS